MKICHNFANDRIRHASHRTANQGGSFIFMLTSPPQLSVNLRGNWIANRQVDANKLYAVLCCIVYWLDSMQYGNDFKLQFKTILKKISFN